MHKSFVTTAPHPRGRAGDRIAVEMTGTLTKVCHGNAGGNIRILLYIGKKGSEVKR